jgi:hypothetical protein
MQISFKRKEVKNKLYQLISFLLLLCLLTTSIPFSSFHNHDNDDQACKKDDKAFESNPCHVSLYHHFDVSKEACFHKKHVSKKIISCEFCKYLSLHKKQAVLAAGVILNSYSVKAKLLVNITPSLRFKSLNTYFNKGPPLV